jgi:endonuclease YncB( thermonuclease family)
MVLFEEITEIVKQVPDGDGFTMFQGVIPIRVRIAYIDAPEDGQIFCRESRMYLSKMIYGRPVNVYPLLMDRWGRWVSSVHTIEGVDISIEMLKSGWAYFFNPSGGGESYQQYEEEAKEKKIGVWSKIGLMKPWEYRRLNRK